MALLPPPEPALADESPLPTLTAFPAPPPPLTTLLFPWAHLDNPGPYPPWGQWTSHLTCPHQVAHTAPWMSRAFHLLARGGPEPHPQPSAGHALGSCLCAWARPWAPALGVAGGTCMVGCSQLPVSAAGRTWSGLDLNEKGTFCVAPRPRTDLGGLREARANPQVLPRGRDHEVW